MQNLDRNSATVKKKLKYNGRAIENKTLPDICAVIYDIGVYLYDISYPTLNLSFKLKDHSENQLTSLATPFL